jgi:deazaflavin-dependent oxidoreductase (nitroreductase family)
LELTVTGRRSGLPRTVSLLYVPDGEDFLLVGSNWGSPRHPAWSTNLSHADKAELHCGGERFPVSVTELRGAQRARAWLTAVHVWPGYEMEQRLASEREFRIFRLRRC